MATPPKVKLAPEEQWLESSYGCKVEKFEEYDADEHSMGRTSWLKSLQDFQHREDMARRKLALFKRFEWPTDKGVEGAAKGYLKEAQACYDGVDRFIKQGDLSRGQREIESSLMFMTSIDQWQKWGWVPKKDPKSKAK